MEKSEEQRQSQSVAVTEISRASNVPSSEGRTTLSTHHHHGLFGEIHPYVASIVINPSIKLKPFQVIFDTQEYGNGGERCNTSVTRRLERTSAQTSAFTIRLLEAR